jgi:hypothetical protein
MSEEEAHSSTIQDVGNCFAIECPEDSRVLGYSHSD